VETKEGKITNWQAIPNQAMNQRGGAGMSAAQAVGNQGAEAVIAGAIGPLALSTLQQLGIKAYAGKNGTVKDNVIKLLKQNLQPISGNTPTPQPGFGRGMGPGGRGFGRGPGGPGRGWAGPGR
jgi:predicted Fe-Mo cluster-binding NifX family protein